MSSEESNYFYITNKAIRMKVKIYLAALAALFLGVQSSSAATEITSGSSYYIQNVSSNLFLCGSNKWGTQGSVTVQGEMFQLDKADDGAYSITDLALSTTNKKFGSNLYTDNAGVNWTIEAVSGEEGVFTIKYDDKYLAQSATAGAHIGYIVEQVTEVTDAAKWYILTADEAIAKLGDATKTAPVDASFLIGDANFSRNHSNTAWSVTASNKNLAGGSNDNMCAESWCSTFDINQTLTGIPNGVYKLSAQAALTDYAELYDGANYPVVYANNSSAIFSNMVGNDIKSDMAALSTAFTAGNYVVGPVSVTVTDGTLKLGVKGTRTDTWCIWDNFQLVYYGVDLNALKENLAALITSAQDISDKMSATAAADLAAALSAAQNCEDTQEAIEAATTALSNALNAATASVSEYKSIAAINAKAEALDEKGVAAYAATLSAYNDGTATLAEAQTAFEAAVKAQGEGAELISLAPATWKGQTGSLGANTTYNKTQFSFAEYYNGGATKADTTVLTQTITGLQNGTYEVTLNLAASYTSGRGFECSTGDSLSVGFANDSIVNLPVVDRTALAADDAVSMTIAATVTDGTLTYGIKNIAAAGNWYAANVSSIIFKEAYVYVATDNRSWDFTKGANYSDAIQADTINWKSNDAKGRWTNVKALDNTELLCGDSAFEMAKGLTFTAAANKILIGVTNNYCLQTTGATKIVVPGVAEGDTIIINCCSSGALTTATITSDGWSDLDVCSVTGATKTEFTTTATKKGEITLSLNNCVRLYTLEIRKAVEQDETATGISAVEAVASSASKFVKNGKLVIAKNGKQYNAAGALLK